MLRTPYRDENGKVQFKSEVAILQKGKMLFIDGILKKEEENELQNENSGLEADDPDAACTFLGGEKAHNIIIKADYNPKQPNNPDYTISVVNKADVISQSDIDMLTVIGKPSAEELQQMYTDDPDLRNYPDWFNFGYQFQKIYKPTTVKSLEQVTSTEDLNISDEETTTVTVKKKPAPAKPAVEETEDEDTFDMGGISEDDLDILG